MKNEIFEVFSKSLDMASIFILLLPLIAITIKRSARNTYSLPLGLSFGLLFLTALIQNSIIKLDSEAASVVAALGMLIQPLLTLMFLKHFVQKKEFKKDLQAGLLILLVANLVLLMINGLRPETILIAFGLGLTLVFMFGVAILRSVIKEFIQPRKGMAKFILITGVVFSHTCFLFIWLVNVQLFEVNQSLVTVISQLTIIIFSTLISIGILMDTKEVSSKRRREAPLFSLYSGK